MVNTTGLGRIFGDGSRFLSETNVLGQLQEAYLHRRDVTALIDSIHSKTDISLIQVSRSETGELEWVVKGKTVKLKKKRFITPFWLRRLVHACSTSAQKKLESKVIKISEVYFAYDKAARAAAQLPIPIQPSPLPEIDPIVERQTKLNGVQGQIRAKEEERSIYLEIKEAHKQKRINLEGLLTDNLAKQETLTQFESSSFLGSVALFLDLDGERQAAEIRICGESLGQLKDSEGRSAWQEILQQNIAQCREELDAHQVQEEENSARILELDETLGTLREEEALLSLSSVDDAPAAVIVIEDIGVEDIVVEEPVDLPIGRVLCRDISDFASSSDRMLAMALTGKLFASRLESYEKREDAAGVTTFDLTLNPIKAQISKEGLSAELHIPDRVQLQYDPATLKWTIIGDLSVKVPVVSPIKLNQAELYVKGDKFYADVKNPPWGTGIFLDYLKEKNGGAELDYILSAIFSTDITY